MDAAGLIFNDSAHYLDHLAPFCALNGLPLILCEPSLASPARLYYPGLEVIETPWHRLTLPPSVISCHPFPMLQAAFPFAHFKASWLPHGFSDKGWKNAVFEHLRHEQTIFVYGSKMIDCIHAKNDELPHVNMIPVGNFRKRYYNQNKAFYRDLVQKTFPAKGRVFLYAPTWEDFENNSSFWQALPLLAKTLPDRDTLLVKPHPNTIAACVARLEQLMGKYENQKNILWVLDFPPIYPLLERCDSYIGDMSSIGYDFLSFNRPMYFLSSQGHDAKTAQGLYLYQCGLHLLAEEYETLFSLDESTRALDESRFQKIRETVDRYTFTQE